MVAMTARRPSVPGYVVSASSNSGAMFLRPTTAAVVYGGIVWFLAPYLPHVDVGG